MTPGDERSTPWTGGDSADLMDDRRCRAMAKQSGKRCRRFPVPGASVCNFHGGAAPAVRAAAARRKAEAEATALLEVIWPRDAEPVEDPVGALKVLAGQMKHAAAVLGARLEGEQLDGPTAVAWGKVLREFRLTLTGMQKLDLETQWIRLEQSRAEVVVEAFIGALEVLQLVPADRDQVTRRYLELLGPVVEGEVVE